ncbi:alpha/beta hydrolase [Steroidobacter sp. S1-65]|uniref:Alpha/beta hydrolase n=1 Tax=Steroidobacter gossypii TaxID=2805490 RepID=A0ABS1X6P5_9GAMM|nr:alpha/beta hydrolase fold domain-containing protein [Steroidobacter gossypii]MBM0108893.1 alpha/beta hydrolase [Steroidobacter gossypii]
MWDKVDAAQQQYLSKTLATLKARYPVTVTDTHIAGVHVGVIAPVEGITPKRRHQVLINLRGGGFVYGRGLSAGQLESIPIAAIGKFKVVTIDYRQAPEYEYPAASEDVEAVYRALLTVYKPQSIGIFGCSAGGALTAQAIAWFQARELPRPGAAGIFCYAPPTTPTLWDLGGDSSIWASGELLPKSELTETDRARLAPLSWYMEKANREDPSAYPGKFDAVLAQFPSTLFLSGTRAYEMSPVIVAHTRLLKLGVDSSLYLIEGGGHAAQLAAIETTEVRDAYNYIARWFQQRLAE